MRIHLLEPDFFSYQSPIQCPLNCCLRIKPAENRVLWNAYCTTTSNTGHFVDSLKWQIPSLCFQVSVGFSFPVFLLPSHVIKWREVNLDNNESFYVSLWIKISVWRKFYYYFSGFHSGFIYLLSLLYSLSYHIKRKQLVLFFIYSFPLLPEKYFSYLLHFSSRCIFCHCEQTTFKVQISLWISERAACLALEVTRFLRVHRTSRIQKWRQRPGTPVALIMKYSAFHLCITDSKWKLLPCDRYSVTHMKCVDDLHLVLSRYLSVLQKQTRRLVLQLVASKEVDNCSCQCYCKFFVCEVSLFGFASLELC